MPYSSAFRIKSSLKSKMVLPASTPKTIEETDFKDSRRSGEVFRDTQGALWICAGKVRRPEEESVSTLPACQCDKSKKDAQISTCVEY